MGIAMPDCTTSSFRVRKAAKLQLRTHTSNTSAAHRAQKTHPAGMPCQNTKGAQTRPGTPAQPQSTARARGGMISAVRSSSVSVICC